MDLYVYYRVRIEHAAALQAGVAALQQKVRMDYTASDAFADAANRTAPNDLRSKSGQEADSQLHCRLRCGLKRRPHPVDARHTWMELYLDVPAGFEARLDAAWLRSGMEALLDGDRHTECFVDCLPCA